MEKSPRLNGATEFLTVAYNGARSVNVLSEWSEFSSASCLAGKEKVNDSSRLDVV